MKEELFVRCLKNADCPKCARPNGHLFNGLCIDCQPARYPGGTIAGVPLFNRRNTDYVESQNAVGGIAPPPERQPE